jgi:integral membrane sensor domain MASE1
LARSQANQSGRLLALLGERRLLQLGGVCLAYYIAARLSLLLSLVGHSVTPLWAPTGVAVVAILAEGYRLWPAVALAAFAVNAPISPSPAAAAGIAVGNTAAPLVAVWLLRRLQFRTELGRPRDALTLLIAGTAATTISASGGTASLVVSGAVAVGHFGSSWLVWWTGDAMGVVLVAPVLWSLRGPRPALTLLRVADATGLLALLVGTVLLAASDQGPGLFIVLLPLVWIAWRFQQQGAALAALLTSTLITLAVVHRQGHFATDSLADLMVILQCFNATVALTSLFSAAAIAERDGVVGRLREIVRVTQEAVIRPPAPFVGPVALAARYESATKEAGVGGDLYETADTPYGVRIVIGDVRGKGLAAVQTASSVLRAFRRWVYSAPDLAELVAHVVRETEHGLLHDEEEFITALFVEIASSGQLRIVNVGHPAPLHVRGREVRTLEPSHTSPPVGVRIGELVPDQFELQPPDRLLLFTDGLLEGRDRAGRFFPLLEVVAEVLDTEDLDQALDDLMAQYLRHVGGRVTDDIAILLAASQVLPLPALDRCTVAG